jgi:hypothetical protein
MKIYFYQKNFFKPKKEKQMLSNYYYFLSQNKFFELKKENKPTL